MDVLRCLRGGALPLAGLTCAGLRAWQTADRADVALAALHAAGGALFAALLCAERVGWRQRSMKREERIVAGFLALGALDFTRAASAPPLMFSPLRVAEQFYSALLVLSLLLLD
jgi:hypothetical protein